MSKTADRPTKTTTNFDPAAAPERLREAAASGFRLLHKPVPPHALRAILSQLLRKAATARQGVEVDAPADPVILASAAPSKASPP